MPDCIRENLSRLMAERGLTLAHLAQEAGLDLRTIRGVLRGSQRPHARTLNRLAAGLGAAAEELFVDPAQLLYRRFDRQTNPMVAEVVADHKELFSGWTEGDFDELHSRVGTGGALTAEGALMAARQMNRKRDLHEKLDLLLETSQAETVAGIIGVLYETVVEHVE
jgi:transcriptional regulator with XRE-family HTH domain